MLIVNLAWTSFDQMQDSLSENIAQTNVGENTTQNKNQLNKFDKFAKEGDLILDTQEAGSIAIACHDYKFELTGCEIDSNSTMRL